MEKTNMVRPKDVPLRVNMPINITSFLKGGDYSNFFPL